MKINRTFILSLHIMLALADREEPETLEAISSWIDIDIGKKYLEKSMRLLSHSGLLNSERGRLGGYQLSRKPEEITLADVYEAACGNIDLCPCIGEPENCGKYQACKIRKAWSEVNDLIWTELHRTTLADLRDSNL